MVKVNSLKDHGRSTISRRIPYWSVPRRRCECLICLKTVGEELTENSKIANSRVLEASCIINFAFKRDINIETLLTTATDYNT
jgi:hypothetical protein